MTTPAGPKPPAPPQNPAVNDDDKDPDPLSDPRFKKTTEEFMHSWATKSYQENKDNVEKWTKNMGKEIDDDDE